MSNHGDERLLSDDAAGPTALPAAFDIRPANRSARLMAAIDALNQIYGRNTLRTGVCGTAPRWGMKSGNRSACFTTRWDELPQVR